MHVLHAPAEVDVDTAILQQLIVYRLGFGFVRVRVAWAINQAPRGCTCPVVRRLRPYVYCASSPLEYYMPRSYVGSSTSAVALQLAIAIAQQQRKHGLVAVLSTCTYT